MLEIFKFYADLIGQLLSKIWGSFQITDKVNYLQFFVAILIVITFIKLLKFQFEDHGINAIKRYHRNQNSKKEEE